ncbi:MAG: 1A family penicillin-binding protein [Parcubacteria group bacterium Gr01-1014_20]|nr:MAG: 1A family penicillin-binding protein [Parcubacteria group bacterium Gr01-1014_20]
MGKKTPRKKHWHRLILVFSAFVVGGLFILAATFIYLYKTLPSIDQIINRQIPQSTKIFDRTGKVLLYEISNGQKRTSVLFEEIPQSLKNATIAIEDENFYTEPGVSVRGILRAVFVNLSKGKILQGGSTITQQLARNAFLSTERTFTRKIKEFFLAIRLARHFPKDQILTLYLNEIPYGATLYGIESASQAYFSKSAKDLTLPESAILAAIPKAPSYYSPWGSHQKELLRRKDLVLEKMRELGKIDEKELQAAKKEKIVFTPQQIQGIKAPHFIIAVQDYLVQKYGEDLVRSGGLRVVTTLDWELQEIAERVVLEGAKRNEELYSGKNAALTTQDPKTGQILALVGSRDYFDTANEGNFNVATQGLRQPGSALKPFVYLAAFEKGYTPSTVLFDVPTNFDTSENPEKAYTPENFDGTFRGPISLRNALAQSVNIPAVKTLYLVGLKNAIATANAFNISTLTDPKRYGLSLVLGGGEVRLIDMVGAYSTLSQDGESHPQTFILEISDHKGNVLEQFREESKVVVDPLYPRMVNDILSDIDARAGLYHSSLYLTLILNQDVALKTGTSNDYRDAWAFGYTPTLVTGVWAGNNDSSPMEKRGSSILAAIPIWHAFMSEALKDSPLETFTKPETPTPQKPVLRGDYLNNKVIHSILYYVDRENPDGPYPEDPGRDPQFKNWEAGVIDWAQKNLSDFTLYNQPGILPTANPSASYAPQIKITSPSVGSFVSSQINLQANLTSGANIVEINVYLNGKLVYKNSGAYGQNYSFSLQLSSLQLEAQNLLEIEVIDEKTARSKEGVIIYR